MALDIIEGANLNFRNRMTLHTSNNCTIAGNNQNSDLVTNNCWSQAGGCGVRAKTNDTYGEGFNMIGGGVRCGSQDVLPHRLTSSRYTQRSGHLHGSECGSFLVTLSPSALRMACPTLGHLERPSPISRVPPLVISTPSLSSTR